MKKIDNLSLPLKHLVKLPNKQGSESPTIFFLHGFGSNMQDLFALSDFFPSDWTCISLEAAVPTGFGGLSLIHI